MSTIQTLTTSDTPADTLITKFNTNFANLNADKLEASAITGKQDTLVSGTNIKTINGVTVLWSGNISIPTLTDGDKWDLTLSGSGTVWTIDNNVVTNAKQATVATNTIKGRSTAGTGNVEDLTPTQVAWMLPVATTSVAGTMSATDKTKLDGLANEWTLLITGTITAGSTYNSGALTTYDFYKIEVTHTTSGATATLNMRFNSDSGASSYARTAISTNGSITQNLWSEFNYFTTTSWTGYKNYQVHIVDRTSGTISAVNQNLCSDASTFNSTGLMMWFKNVSVSSIQMSTIVSTGGTIKIYGKNF